MAVVESSVSHNAGSYVSYLYLGRGEKYKKNVKNHTNRARASYVEAASPGAFVKMADDFSKLLGTKIKLYTNIISFKKSDLGGSDKDIQHALDLAVRINHKLHPYSPLMCVVHTDGKSGLTHVHSASINICLNDHGKKAHSIQENKTIGQIRKVANALCAEDGLSVIKPDYAPRKHKQTYKTLANIKEHGEAWAKANDFDYILSAKAEAASKKATDFDDFERLLGLDGIKLIRRDHKKAVESPDPQNSGKTVKKAVVVPGFVFSMMDAGTSLAGKKPRWRRRKASKFGTYFRYEALKKLFAKNKQKQLAEQMRRQKQIAKAKKSQAQDAKKRKHEAALAPFIAADMAIANARFDKNPAIKKMRQSGGYKSSLRNYRELEQTRFEEGQRSEPLPKTRTGWENEYDSFYVDEWNVSADMNSEPALWIKHSDLVNKPAKKAKQKFESHAGSVIPGKPKEPAEAKSELVSETKASAAKTEPSAKTEPAEESTKKAEPEPATKVQANAAKTEPAVKTEPAANGTEQSQEGKPEDVELASENAMPTQPSRPSQPEAGSQAAQNTMPSVQPPRVAVRSFHHGDSIPAWQPIDAIGYESRAGHGIQGFYSREWTALVWLAHARQHFELSDRHEMQRKWLEPDPYIMWTRHAMAKAAKSKDPLVRHIGTLSEAVKSGYAKGYFDDMPGVKEAMALFKKQPASKPPLPGAQGSVPQKADKGVPVPGVNF